MQYMVKIKKKKRNKKSYIQVQGLVMEITGVFPVLKYILIRIYCSMYLFT